MPRAPLPVLDGDRLSASLQLGCSTARVSCGMLRGMQDLGRWLIGVGIVVLLVGVVLAVAPRLPWVGRLPGDFVVRRDSFTLYFPLATSIVVSVVLTILLNLFGRC